MSFVTAPSLPTLLLVSFATVALAGCGFEVTIGDDAERRVRRQTLAVDDATRIDITTENGAITVERGAPGTVDVETTVIASRPGDADVSIGNDGERIGVDGDCESSFWRSCKISFAVAVPPGIDVTVRSANGRIEIDGVDGRLEATTDNGAIAATALSTTDAHAGSGNGRISLSFATAPDEVDVETNNGSIEVRVPADDGYDVDASSHNGSIDIDLHDDPDAARSITARSDNGSIEIGHAAD